MNTKKYIYNLKSKMECHQCGEMKIEQINNLIEEMEFLKRKVADLNCMCILK